MQEYYLDEFRNRENYVNFIAYMLEHSDFFSLVFYRSRKTDPLKRSSREIKDSLRRYHLHSEKMKEWPGPEIRDDSCCETAYYYSDPACLETLSKVDDIFEWYYPNAPANLAFYRDGYCWMWISVYEELGAMFLGEEEAEELKELGVNLTEAVFRVHRIEKRVESGFTMAVNEVMKEPTRCDIKTYLDKYRRKKK